jgi:hypothetical protein
MSETSPSREVLHLEEAIKSLRETQSGMQKQMYTSCVLYALAVSVYFFVDCESLRVPFLGIRLEHQEAYVILYVAASALIAIRSLGLLNSRLLYIQINRLHRKIHGEKAPTWLFRKPGLTIMINRFFHGTWPSAAWGVIHWALLGSLPAALLLGLVIRDHDWWLALMISIPLVIAAINEFFFGRKPFLMLFLRNVEASEKYDY